MKITNEDNMDLMSRYEDNYFDLAIVDPPYGINASKGVGLHSRKKFAKADKEWDNKTPTKNYWNELFRVSKNQIVCGANYFIEFLYSSKSFICWVKNNPAPNFAEAEFIWTSLNINGKVFDTKKQIQHQIMWEGGSIHPTQKPIQLYEWLLMNYATCKTCKNQGGYYEDVAGDGGSQMWQVCDDCDTHERPVRVLDTHLGSGSIAIACHNLGFDLTACELDKEYYDAAMKRINEHKQQIRLF